MQCVRFDYSFFQELRSGQGAVNRKERYEAMQAGCSLRDWRFRREQDPTNLQKLVEGGFNQLMKGGWWSEGARQGAVQPQQGGCRSGPSWRACRRVGARVLVVGDWNVYMSE